MHNHPIKCPKCSYLRTEEDQYVMAGICPACGIAYNKWHPDGDVPEANRTDGNLRIIEEGNPESELFASPWQRFLSLLTYTPDKVDSTTFWGRCIVYVFFLVWGGRFMVDGLSWQTIGNSFMHNINLPFHEFGHVLFRPFGQFMTILGGSLFQVLLPLLLGLVFLLQQHNPFAAAIMLWWCGQSFIDISPYIADAQYRGLPLIMGMGEDSHDWGNLLTLLNRVDDCYRLANTSFTLGACLMIVSMVWGGYLLYKQRKVLSDF